MEALHFHCREAGRFHTSKQLTKTLYWLIYSLPMFQLPFFMHVHGTYPLTPLSLALWHPFRSLCLELFGRQSTIGVFIAEKYRQGSGGVLLLLGTSRWVVGGGRWEVKASKLCSTMLVPHTNQTTTEFQFISAHNFSNRLSAKSRSSRQYFWGVERNLGCGEEASKLAQPALRDPGTRKFQLTTKMW